MRNNTKAPSLARKGRLTDAKLLLIITICVFAVMYVCAVLFLGSGFKKPQTFFNILNENAALLILSCGMSLVMITGGIGTAFGLVQGFLIAYLEIQPFIVTLAGMFFAKGMTTIVNATQFNVENAAFKALKETRIYVPGMGSVNKLGAYVPAYVEIGVVVALVVVAVLFVVLRWTKFGRSVYAVGGNSYSANMLAINVKRTKFLAHLICGILAGIGGFVYFLHVGSGSPSHASGAEMNAIASSIIGGTMLTGGVGNIIGTLFGVLSLSTIKNIVSSLGLDEHGGQISRFLL